MSTNRADLTRLLRDATGLGLLQIQRAYQLAEDETRGDILWAVGCIAASGYAVNVKSDRSRWNRDKGREMAARWREDPAFAEVVEALEAEALSDCPPILPCIECSISFGKPSAPVTYLEQRFMDEEQGGLQVCCPGCSTDAWGMTPKAAVVTWNETQRAKLAKANEFLGSWQDPEAAPAGPSL